MTDDSCHALARGELRARLIETLAAEPEVYALYTFGREVEGEADEYSDIDLCCCSADPAATQRKYRDLLGGISPIRSSFLMIEEPELLVEMILLREYRPYQKIDFSIARCIEAQAKVGPLKEVYRAPGEPHPGRTQMLETGRIDALQNRMNDLLFSIPRFAKCLFRRDFDMYRRWAGMLAMVQALLYERHSGWREGAPGKLNPAEYRSLYKALDPDERRLLETMQPLDGRPDLIDGFQQGLGLYVDLYREKAAHLGEELDEGFIGYMKGFAGAEVGRFEEGGRHW